MRLITAEGIQAVPIADPHERSIVGGHANAVAQFLATGETKPLAPYEGVSLAGRRLLTDPDAIEAWAAQSELEFEDVYDASGR